MEDFIYIELHHGGKFERTTTQFYSGGATTWLTELDKDKLSYFELLGLVEDLGYDKCKCRLYYKNTNESMEGLRLVYSDQVIPDMIEKSKQTGGLMMFVEHEQPVTTQSHATEPNVSTEVRKSTQPSGESVVDLGIDDEVDTEEDSVIEFDDDSDDESLVVNSIGDESDEEIIEVRKKLQNLKVNKTLSKVPIQTNISLETNDSKQTDTTLKGEKVVPDSIQRFIDDDDDLESSMYHIPDSDDDEVESMTPIIEGPIFNPDTPMDKITFQTELRFSTKAELKEAVTKYAISGGFGISFPKNDKKKLLAVCVPPCPWRLWATPMQLENSFQVKSYNDEHQCGRETSIKLLTSKWLARDLGDKIRENPRWKPKSMMAEVLEKFNCHVTKNQCSRAKSRALIEVESGLKLHYVKLRNYGKEILRTNPGSTIKFSVDRENVDDPPYFKRMYVCLDAIKKCWLAGCRPVIGLDGCFLKSVCKGQLLTAVGRDANNQMFPIAWAVVEVECKSSWLWFIDLLIDDIGIGNDGEGWTLITDQQKGLDIAIRNLIPLAEHRCCARHIYDNFRKVYPGVQLKKLFWRASKSGTPEEFENVMKEIMEIQKDAVAYLRKRNKKQWVRAFFSTTSKCDAVENNMSEAFNGTILEARAKPIIDMLEDIRDAVRQRMEARRKVMENLRWDHDNDACPKIREKVEENKNWQRYWTSTFFGNKKFEVKQGQNGYVVDLDEKTCSCRSWDLTGIPCPHAISAIYYMKHDPYQYVHNWLTVGKWRACYQYLLQPLNGKPVWPADTCDPILPPPARRLPGRPKKKRTKGANEEPKRSKTGSLQVTKRGRKMRCTNCGVYGHNKKGCKNKKKEVGVSKPREPPTKKQKTVEELKVQKRKETSQNTKENMDLGNKNLKKREEVPKGFGLYMAPDGEVQYLKGSGHSKPTPKGATTKSQRNQRGSKL